MDPAPNSVATRSKLSKPTRPQLRPPTMSRIRVMRFNGFIAFSMIAFADTARTFAGIAIRVAATRGDPPLRLALRRQNHGVDDMNDAVRRADIGHGDFRIIHHDGVAFRLDLKHLPV